MAFSIIRSDITKVKADAIVNTANPHPTFGSGTDHAIYEAAGVDELLAARKQIGEIARGDAVETPAFALNAKYIIHTVGPHWQGGENGEFDTLRSCYENSLKLAEKLKCRSIAFPLIASGSYGFPKDKALQIALSVIQPFVMENSMDVILVVFDKKAFELSGKVVENVREYVDSHYVEEAHKRERYYEDREYALNNSILNDRDRKAFYERRRRHEMFNKLKDFAEYDMEEATITADTMPDESFECLVPDAVSEKIDIDKVLLNQEKTFQEKLLEIIDERGLTAPQVYKNYISKQVYSKILLDKDYHPNKYTAIALCLSLHLNIEETKDLIGRAGWALSQSSKADLVVSACIQNGEYNVMEIDVILFDYDLPTLDKIK